MNANSTRVVVVEGAGDQVVGHVGLHALGRFADRLGVGEALSGAVGWAGGGKPVHDRGRVLTQAMLMLAGGGESCADIESLASQGRLFGEVCSDSTLFRTFVDTLDPEAVGRAADAFAGVRAEVWRRLPFLGGDDPVVLDVDASLVEIHSENKEGTAANYKRGFGFHPLFCFADATGEALAATLRPGNATANNVADLLGVLDDGISQLPQEVARGHRVGDDAAVVNRQVMVRSDSAAGKTFAQGCRHPNVGFAVAARTNKAVSGAVAAANAETGRWVAALKQDATPHRPEDDHRVSEVCEVTDLVDLSDWPAGTRLIIRREPLHPGAQQTLLPDLEFRFWGHYTDQGGDPPELDRHMRAHARVEDHIGRLKDSGLTRFPFTNLRANQAWLQVVCWGADLVRWFQLLCLAGPLSRARPKRLRWTLWHTPARIISSGRRNIVRILDGWPTTRDILGAYQAIAALT
jgi:hypothetical protein